MPGSKRRPGSRIRVLLTAFALAATGSGLAVVLPHTAQGAQAAALPTSWATVVNKGSGKCVDARGAGAADGTVVQQYACNSSQAQQWRFQDTSDSRVQVGNRNDTTKAWDVTDISTADSAPVQL
ncbi:RICIN domain-containing protein [Streptomyces sp. NBC_01613]|uniref:RICIN domain-containing protein n=1 Tax=Streptomyces sp. NBC_01613 TaxID=2975896 RepID=UPI00386E9371